MAERPPAHLARSRAGGHQQPERADTQSGSVVRDEMVANAGFRDEVAQLYGIVFQFLPQLLEVDSQIVRVRCVRRPPYLGQQLLVCDHHAGISGRAGDDA